VSFRRMIAAIWAAALGGIGLHGVACSQSAPVSSPPDMEGGDATKMFDGGREDTSSGSDSGGPACTVLDATLHYYTGVYVKADLSNQIVALHTTLTVPPEPPPTGTLFLWPGLDPATGGKNFLPIDNGVLQPVLTWGPSCAPGQQPLPYSTWWVSAQYVNVFGSQPGFTGCHGGPVMPVGVGDSLTMDMTLSGTVWTQVVTDVQTAKSVQFSFDLQGQAQNLAYFQLEGDGQHSVAPGVFTNTTITFASPQSTCVALDNGGPASWNVDPNDVAPTVLSNGNTECRIATMTLYDEGCPIRPSDAGASVVGCGGYDAAVEYDAAGYDGGAADGGALPGPPPVVCSGQGQPAASLSVTNDAPCTIELWWVNFACQEVFYDYIDPNGGSVVQPTYETHVWRLRAGGTHELLREIPMTSATVAVTYP
jgi:hypothetical protein